MANSTTFTATAAGAAAVTLAVLWYSASAAKEKKKAAKAKLVRNLETVGKAVDDKSPGGIPEYDVIVVGGGTAGCVVASRVSELPHVRVLLLEAGLSGVALPESKIPLAWPRLLHTRHDWDLYTVPQNNLDGRKRYWPRGKMLGGCSSINAMVFHHGAPSDFDEWVTDQEGGEGWAYSSLKYYLRKMEGYHSRDPPKAKYEHRGTEGPIKFGHNNYTSPFANALLSAAQSTGLRATIDYNTHEGTLGAGEAMSYIDHKGRRSSSESAYLTPEVLDRPNLKVAIGAHTHRILFETVPGAEPRAVGVEFSSGPGKPVYRAHARKEVILSAGSVHTPQILKLSGIGPAKELQTHNIPVVKDLPGVGENMIDHLSTTVRFKCKPGISLDYLGPGSGRKNKIWEYRELARWLMFGSGPLCCNIAESAIFFRTTDEKLFPPEKYPKPVQDTTSGPEAPDIEVIGIPFPVDHRGPGYSPRGDYFSIMTIHLRPTSRGTITLASNNPFDAPVIDPRYFSTQNDRDVHRRGVQYALRLTTVEPVASMVAPADSECDNKLLDASDEELDEFIRRRSETVYHPTSTAKMAPISEGGVVDGELRVHGIVGLRCVDLSVVPTIPSGHTAAAAFVVGERASDLIKDALKA